MPIVGKGLQRVLNGYFADHAVPTNLLRLNGFGNVNYTGSSGRVSIASPASMSRDAGSASLSGRALPCVTDLKREPFCDNPARTVLCGGAVSNGRPYLEHAFVLIGPSSSSS